ncbi:MAG: polyprenyl synthetase family protein [Dehalococcoidales bacterium]|nr:polyprenyl synthetase family protein [Dehalococcoidales bacterium]
MSEILSLEKIYAPVQADLDIVGDWLTSVTRVSYVPQAKMLEHSLKDTGKKIRPALVLLSGKFYHYNLDTMLPMAAAVELLHTATLVHDDAIDDSDVRRGQPTINATWNTDKAILLGDYLFATAEEFTTRTGNLRVIRLCAETLQLITTGELNQAFNEFNLNQTYDEYLKRIAGKTASLLAAATESGAILSDAPEESVRILKEYGYNIGLAFQIVDDILDFIGTEQELGKPVASDLTQGTLTLPAMLLLQRYPTDNPVKRVFESPGLKDEIARAIDMVRNSNITDECYKAAAGFRAKAIADLQQLPDCPAREALYNLADFVVQRRK